MSDKWHEKHLEMVDVVNNSTTDEQHKAATEKLFGFRWAACHCVGIRLFRELIEHASEVQRQRGVHRDMRGGVWLDWEPAPTGIDNPTDTTKGGVS